MLGQMREIVRIVLTTTSIQAEVGARKLDLSIAGLDQPLLSFIAWLAIKTSRCKMGWKTRVLYKREAQTSHLDGCPVSQLITSYIQTLCGVVIGVDLDRCNSDR